MSDHVTIFIVDDDSQLSESLGALVRSIGLKTRLFRSPEEFLDEYESDMRGCVVLDIRMQGMSGTKLFEVMKSRGYSIPVIFLTAYGDVPTAVQAIREGAVDFLIKPAHPSEFCAKVLQAVQLDERRRGTIEAHNAALKLLDQLSDREEEVLDLVIQGLSSKQIASRLNIASKTVDKHRTSLMQKLGASNSADLVRIALGVRNHGSNESQGSIE